MTKEEIFSVNDLMPDVLKNIKSEITKEHSMYKNALEILRDGENIPDDQKEHAMLNIGGSPVKYEKAHQMLTEFISEYKRKRVLYENAVSFYRKLNTVRSYYEC
jgi:hypothetical protein